MSLPVSSGLVAFWDFQDASLSSRDGEPIRLRHAGEPLEAVSEGVFGPRSLRFRARGELAAGYLFATAEEAPSLGFGGPRSRFTAVAWIKREATPYGGCQFVAGVWNEHRRRQYGLFLNLHIWDSAEQVGAHVSRHGGPTPGYPYCMDAAIGATPVSLNAWHCAAISYDGVQAAAWLDGALDAREPRGEAGRNPFHHPGELLKGDADFSVGAALRPTRVQSDGQGGFVETGSTIGNPFVGLLGGLAVYDRDISAQEHAALVRIAK